MIDLNNYTPSPTSDSHIQAVRDACFARPETVLMHLFPAGRREGSEFVVGSLNGEPGKSLSVCLAPSKVGIWKDFATGESGHDLIALWMKVNRVEFLPAIAEMERFLGTAPTRTAPVSNPSSRNEAPGLPGPIWNYHDIHGNVIATHQRYDNPETGKKQFRPRDLVTGRATFPEPRPLYNLHRIMEMETVYVVEGEKCADALTELGFVATTAMGGAQSVSKTDWSPLQGKQIVIWPDNDEPGFKYAEDVQAQVSGTILTLPADKPTKWDAADAIEEGFDVKSFLEASPVPPPTRALANWAIDAYTGPAPARRWLVQSTIPMAAVTLFAAAGDSGKGMLCLDAGIKVAAGPGGGLIDQPLVFGNRVVEHGAVVIYTAEDDRAEIHRRMESVDPGGRRFACRDRLYVVPLPNAGGPMPLVVPGPSGPAVHPNFHAMRRDLAGIPNLKLVVIDPLASFVMVDVNADPAAGAYTTGLLSSLATELDCAVLVCHHMSKGGLDKSAGPERARSLIRGTTALVDGVRAAYAIWAAKEQQARQVCQMLDVPWASNRVFEGALVKSNGPGDREVKTFVRSDRGLLEVRNAEIAVGSVPRREMLEILLEHAERAAAIGRPFTLGGKAGLYARREELSPILQKQSKRVIEELAQSLLNDRQIVKAVGPRSKLVQYLDVPQGPFSMGEGFFAEGFLELYPVRGRK